jgi:tetratricopeptide (TPR) repeat protein
MIRVETGHYIKGLHSLLNAHFVLRNFLKFDETLKKFEKFAETDRVRLHDNFRIQAFIYIYSAKINQHSMLGTFNEGILLVPQLLEKLTEYEMFIDEHRIMVFNYKIASMYFGNGDYGTCIDYLQKIINENTEVRGDLQSYSRLMHLMAHYELGNIELMEYLTKSVYRFMAKKENLSFIEKEMFKFVRKAFHISNSAMRTELEDFLDKIKALEKNRFETRVFAYMDIISWVESKVYRKTMGEILQEKYRARKRRA